MHTARRGILATALLAAALAAQKAHDIGSVGATLKLDDGWRRQTLDKDDDADQFNGSKGSLFRRREVYATVRELQGIYENEGDYVRALDWLTTVGIGEPVEVVAEAQWTRASRRIEAKVNGVQVVFHSDLLVQPGLAYHVLTWSPRKDRRFLAERSKALHDGFSFPAADATWRTAAKPIRHEARDASLRITFEAAPVMLCKEPNEYDEQVRLVSPDGDHIVMVYTTDHGANADYLLGQELQALTEYEESTVELSRKPFALADCDATLMICQSKQHTTHSLLMQRNGSALMMRYFAPGKAGDARPVRDALLRSIAVVAGPTPLTLPDVGATPPAEPEWPARTRAFAGRGRQLAELEMWSPNGSVQLDDGSVVVCEHRAAWRIDDDGAKAVYRSNEYGQWCVVPHGGGLLLSQDGKLCKIVDGKVGERLCDAQAAAACGEDLFVVQTRPRPRIGLERNWRAQDDVRQTLVRRRADGSEQRLADLGDLRIQQLVASPSGAHVAVRSQQAGLLSPLEWPQQVVVVSTADGERAPLGAWRTCNQVAATSDGWLVTGTPVGRPTGIWLVRADGQMQVLATGSGLFGIACTDRELTYAITLGNGRTRIVRTSRADCLDHGAGCQPFSIEALDAIGTALLAAEPTPPRTHTQLQAVLARADAIATEQVGATLPATGVATQALIACVNEALASPNGNGRRLLALLVARALLAQGGTWVEPAENGSWDRWLAPTQLPADDAFAATIVPSSVVVTWLDDSEGYSDHLTRTAVSRRGVPLLVGVDRRTLVARAQGLVVPGLREAAAEGRTKVIADALYARPHNDRLREDCYLTLAEFEQFDAILEIARHFDRSQHATAIDRVALLNARLHRLADDDMGQLFEDGMKAVQLHPRDARLYLALARTAERAFPQEPAKARQCYERMLQLDRYGKDAEIARKAIERLSK
jgi:hypothetical protein